MRKRTIVFLFFVELDILFNFLSIHNGNFQDNLVEECPVIVNLTGNTSTLGNPIISRIWYGWDGWDMRSK